MRSHGEPSVNLHSHLNQIKEHKQEIADWKDRYRTKRAENIGAHKCYKSQIAELQVQLEAANAIVHRVDECRPGVFLGAIICGMLDEYLGRSEP